jgi:hypothetical protein
MEGAARAAPAVRLRRLAARPARGAGGGGEKAAAAAAGIFPDFVPVTWRRARAVGKADWTRCAAGRWRCGPMSTSGPSGRGRGGEGCRRPPAPRAWRWCRCRGTGRTDGTWRTRRRRAPRRTRCANMLARAWRRRRATRCGRGGARADARRPEGRSAEVPADPAAGPTSSSTRRTCPTRRRSWPGRLAAVPHLFDRGGPARIARDRDPRRLRAGAADAQRRGERGAPRRPALGG